MSCHYAIDEAGRITQMVAEEMRAWHAGEAMWAGESDINSASIGIEIHNPGHEMGYPDFPEAQLEAVEALCKDIIARHGMRPERVLAHSDVAPTRKKDPGEKFPWARLARAGIGHWVEPQPVIAAEAGMGIGVAGPLVADVQTAVAQLRLWHRGHGRGRCPDRVRGDCISAPFPPGARRRPHRPVDHHHAGTSDRGAAERRPHRMSMAEDDARLGWPSGAGADGVRDLIL